MKRKLLVMLTVFLMLIVSACGGGGSSKTSSDGAKTIKFAFSGAETHIHNKSALIFKNEVEKKSNGKITVDLYPNNTLGTDAETMSQLKSGAVEMAAITSGELANHSPSFNAWFMPFLFNNAEEVYKMGQTEEAKALFDTLADAGVHSLGYFLIEMRDVLAKEEQINSLDQFKGINIRVTPSPAIVDFWQTVGANPTPVDFSELYSAYQTGVVNTIDSGSMGMASGKFYEIGKYYTTTNHMAFNSAILTSNKFWDSLSDEEKNIIEESMNVAIEQNIDIYNELSDEAMASMKDQGVKFTEIQMGEELQKLTNEFIEKYTSEDEKIKAFVEKAQEISSK